MLRQTKQSIFSLACSIKMKTLMLMVSFTVPFFPLTGQADDLIFSPPFNNASSASLPDEYLYNFGSGLVQSLGETDLDSGTICQRVFTAAHIIGGQGISEIDEVYQEFAVPVSGTYQISFRGTVSGTLHAAGFTYFLGVGKSAFALELKANVGGVNCAKQELFKTDLGWGSFVTEVVLQDSILALLNATAPGSGEILGLMGQISDNITPVMSWDSDGFTLQFTGYLEQGQSYFWSFYPRVMVASFTLGIAEEVAFEDVNIVLEEVRISAVGIAGNQLPDTPNTVSPPNGTNDVNLTPSLEASGFSDPDGDNHAASRWQIANDVGLTDLVYESGEVDSCTTLRVPQGVLQNDNTYYWRAQYKDDRNAWSYWSEAASFLTVPSSHITGYVKDTTSGNGINASLYVCKADNNLIYQEWGTGMSGIFGIPVPSGDYYILVTAGNCVNEKTYSNAVTRVPESGFITVEPNEVVNVGDIYLSDVPDLRGESFDTTGNPLNWGNTANISFSCANRGTQASAAFKVNCYLSADDTIQEYDFFLGEVNVSGLAANEVYNATMDMALPAVPPNDMPSYGYYCIGMIVDPNNVVEEADEINNANRGFGLDKKKVVIPNPDLNNDGIVNSEDFAILANHWVEPCSDPDWCGGADFDRSEQVDFEDLRYMADNWLRSSISVVLVEEPANQQILNLLRSMGIEPVIQAEINSSILSYDMVIVCSYSARDPDGYLRQMMQLGKGVITVEGVPYFLAGSRNLSSIGDWLGADYYGNVGTGSTLETVAEHEITAGVGLETELWYTLGHGAAALSDIRSTATVVGEWKPSNNTAAILVNEWEGGRSVFHSVELNNTAETLNFHALKRIWRNSILWVAGKNP